MFVTLRHLTRFITVLGMVALASSAALAQQPVRVGSKNFTEQFVLGELYSQALTAQGYAVLLNFGELFVLGFEPSLQLRNLAVLNL